MVGIRLQINNFDKELKSLQKKYGSRNCLPINGAGCIDKPELFFIFMNPTARNISADPRWEGLRAPWLGTKNIWKMIYLLKLIDKNLDMIIQKAKAKDWTEKLVKDIYTTLARNKVYITNLAKCTQEDARPLKNEVFKKYLKYTKKEILIIKPKRIVSFGVQVSSILLKKKINIKEEKEEEVLINGKYFKVYPTYYPVGQGMRNLKKAVDRINSLL